METNYDENCIFCKILGGIIPSRKIYEDEDFIAILDAFPSAKGHVIIIPKMHVTNIFEMPDELAAKVFGVAKKVAAAVKQATGCDGVNILQNNGKAAGQSVFHLHVHVIPRFLDDSLNITWDPNTLEDAVMDEIADKIRKNIK